MNKIPTQIENPKGLHARYFVSKWIKGLENKFEWPLERRIQAVDKKAEYFVLRLDEGGSDPEHIKACRIGVHAYANAIEHHLPELAKDLRERYPVPVNTGLKEAIEYHTQRIASNGNIGNMSEWGEFVRLINKAISQPSTAKWSDSDVKKFLEDYRVANMDCYLNPVIWFDKLNDEK